MVLPLYIITGDTGTLLKELTEPWLPLQSNRQFFILFSSQSGTFIGFSENCTILIWISKKVTSHLESCNNDVEMDMVRYHGMNRMQILDNFHWVTGRQSSKNHLHHSMKDKIHLHKLNNNLFQHWVSTFGRDMGLSLFLSVYFFARHWLHYRYHNHVTVTMSQFLNEGFLCRLISSLFSIRRRVLVTVGLFELNHNRLSQVHRIFSVPSLHILMK